MMGEFRFCGSEAI